MAKTASELYVITLAKNLVDYIFSINENAPKKYRYSIVKMIDNECLDLIKKFYKANIYQVNNPKRREIQNEIIASLNSIDFIFYMGVKRQCYNSHQYQVLSKKLHDCLFYLNRWIMSDANRIK